MADKPLVVALLAVQSEAPTLKKDETATVQTKAGGSYSYSYISLDSIVEQVGPLLAKNGLVWSTFPSYDEASGEPTLRYTLTHTSGESMDGEMRLLLAAKDAQAQGSAITYARRYALCAVLNLVADDDDDGAGASAPRAQSSQPNGKPGRPSDKQAGLIQKLVKGKGLNIPQLKTMLAAVGADGVEIEEGWPSKLTGGREGQASALIDMLMNGPIPEAGETVVPESDVPSSEDEFVHPQASFEGTPING